MLSHVVARRWRLLTSALATLAILFAMDIAGAALGSPSIASGAGSNFLYADSLAPEWQLANYGATVNLSSTAYVHSGTYAVSFAITGKYGAFAASARTGSFDLTPFTNIRFYINGEATGGQRLGLLVRYAGTGTSSKLVAIDKYTSGRAVAAGEWRLVDMPLTALGLTSSLISSIALQAAVASSQPAVSVDDIEFYNAALIGTPTVTSTQAPTASTTNTPINSATATDTPTNTPTPTDTPTSTPVASATPTVAATATQAVTSSPTPPVGSSFTLYADTLALPWQPDKWGATVNVASTTYVHSGSDAVSYTITGNYGAFAPTLRSGTFDLVPYTGIRFYINGEMTGGQKLGLMVFATSTQKWTRLVAIDRYIVGGSVVAGQWRLVDIPLSALGLTSSVISRVALQDIIGTPQPALSVDDIEFYGAGQALTPTPSFTVTPTPSGATQTPTPTVSVTPLATPTVGSTPTPAGTGGSGAALLLYYATKSPSDTGFEKTTRYYGLSKTDVNLATTVLTDSVLRNSSGRYYSTAYIDGANIDLALDSAEQAVLRGAVEFGGMNLLVSDLRIGSSPAVQMLTAGEISGSSPVADSAKDYIVSTVAPAVTRQFSGLTITYGAAQRDYALTVAPGSSHSQVLVRSTDDSQQTYALFVAYQSGLGRVFLVSNYVEMNLQWNTLADNYAATANGNTFNQQWFSQTVPVMMFVRFSAGDSAWHNDHHYANFTLDDPPLQAAAFDYPGILQEALSHNFHFTLAAVPANYAEAEQSVADLFKGNPDRLSVVQHGNNHDGYEFYNYSVGPNDPYPARPLADQEADIVEGRARAQALFSATGLSCAPVMVFPFNISPAETLTLLKKYNYQATINSQDYPLDGTRSWAWDSYVYPAELEYSDFAVIKRYGPDTVPYPFDLFLDRPAYLYGHSDLFTNRGIGAINPIADAINSISGGVEWRSLNYIMNHLYLEKTNDDGTVDLMLYGNQVVVANDHDVSRAYHLKRAETANVPIYGVYLDGVPITYSVSGGTLQVDVTLPARGSTELKIVYGAGP